MKRFVKTFVACAVLLAMFVPYHRASAAENIIRFRGLGTTAYFYSEDPTGCIQTGASVFANKQAWQDVPGLEAPQVYVDVQQYDQCTGQLTFVGVGQKVLARQEFSVLGSLESAELHTTVTVFDGVSGTSLDLAIHLTWDATSGVIHENSHYIYTFEGCHASYTNNSKMREAVATGTISDGTTNYIPLPSFAANIYDSKRGEVSNGC